MTEVNEFKRRLEEIGEDKVRENLARNIYDEKKRGIVVDWLQSKERRRELSRMDESLQLAKSAKQAAWVSAIAAFVSALAAIAAWLWG